MIDQHSRILHKRREIWESKEILRRLYHHWHSIIEKSLKPGLILEIGGGSGNLKEFSPDVISSDILFVPWLDVVADAHHLPFKDNSLDNIVLFDVLHHLFKPTDFFSEAKRVLKQKGRVVFMEPYVSLASFFVYRFLHPEGMVWNINPFNIEGSGTEKNYFNGNQAIPTLIFEKYEQKFINAFPEMEIIIKNKTDFILYPLSGGFNNPNLCPLFLFPALKYLEKILQPLNCFLAFRIFIVIEKK